jgi:pimeloyl-ACP methyl ester carboxylesterase
MKDRLHRIQARNLVISGSEERLVPQGVSDEIARRIPPAKLVKVERASHALVIDRAWRFNREVPRFLRDG